MSFVDFIAIKVFCLTSCLWEEGKKKEKYKRWGYSNATLYKPQSIRIQSQHKLQKKVDQLEKKDLSPGTMEC